MKYIYINYYQIKTYELYQTINEFNQGTNILKPFGDDEEPTYIII